jgi:integrase/recombinase XerD
MSALAHELDRYLAIRRSFGFDLVTDARVLRRFVAFAESQDAPYVTTALFLKWKAAFGNAGQGTWAARFGMVRLFAQWLNGIDPRHEVLPKALIPGRHRRTKPYIYSDQEIAQIVEEAARLPSIYGIRGLTYSTLFGLVANTGLRITEAIGLDNGDVDLDTAVLTIRMGKAGKARLVPVSASTADRLAAYADERDRLLGQKPKSFFALEAGTRPDDCAVRYNFALVCQRIGLRSAQRLHKHGRGPRIHDLRHTFAARALINWYRTGKHPEQEMVKLSTYLGHAKPANTYWYIEAVPELLELAAERAAQMLGWEAGR